MLYVGRLSIAKVIAVENVFREILKDAKKGKHIVESYYKLHADATSQRVVILIFPDDDKRLLSAVFRCLDEFLNKFYFDAAVILSSIGIGIYELQSYTLKPLYLYQVNQSDMEAVMRYYSFIQECPNIKLFSFQMPFNQKSNDLIDFKDITADTFTYYCLFGLLGQRVECYGE